MSVQDALALVCLACDRPFTIERRSGGGRYPRFCSPACRRSRHLAQLKGYRAEGRYPRNTPTQRRPIAKSCEVCLKPFETTNRAIVCCGISCGQVLASRRRSATRTAKSIAARQRQCEHCGGAFVARHPSGSAIAGRVREGRFCSRSCAGAFRTALSVRETTAATIGEESGADQQQLPLIFMMATNAKQRMQEMRERQRLGIEIIRNVPISDRFRLIDRLIEWGLISEGASSDDRAVAEAIGRLLDKISVTRNSPFG